MSFPVKAVVFDWAGTMVDFGCMAPPTKSMSSISPGAKGSDMVLGSFFRSSMSWSMFQKTATGRDCASLKR